MKAEDAEHVRGIMALAFLNALQAAGTSEVLLGIPIKIYPPRKRP